MSEPTVDQLPVRECGDCGQFYVGIHKGCEKPGRGEGVPVGIPGHSPEITPMRTGGYRAECSCGFFDDYTSRRVASVVLKAHIQAERRRGKP